MLLLQVLFLLLFGARCVPLSLSFRIALFAALCGLCLSLFGASRLSFVGWSCAGGGAEVSTGAEAGGAACAVRGWSTTRADQPQRHQLPAQVPAFVGQQVTRRQHAPRSTPAVIIPAKKPVEAMTFSNTG